MPYVSALDLFSIGIGPSSSHTVGPMRAAKAFAVELAGQGLLSRVASLHVRLCGSLGATGIGHGTPDAVLAGLAGLEPETCDPEAIPGGWERLARHDAVADETVGLGRPARPRPATGPDLPAAPGTVAVLGTQPVTMMRDDIELAPRTRMPLHPNAVVFEAADAEGGLLAERVYYSIGGGFIATADELETLELTREPVPVRTSPREPTSAASPPDEPGPQVPLPFSTAAELLAVCEAERLSIAGVAWANEAALRDPGSVRDGLDTIWRTMSGCVDAGLTRDGRLPGTLKVQRRARAQRERLEAMDERGEDTTIEWLQAYAMAVNEENADGGRIVTAPTNGAAGVLPAVGRYFLHTHPGTDRDAGRRARAMRTFLLTAAAIGTLYKSNASISGAEAGCQGEVGSACSMAAGAVCALLGGTPAQVENAAEIAMEHNLGLTCDPVGGLVQVPCIERNAIAACTAVSAARMALQGNGSHVVSLDAVIETMRQTGLDMSTKYKETSLGGLAVNVVEC